MKKNTIVDCILFYDEIDMLKFRLSQNYEFVDWFIILECDVDFKNNEKELNFEKNKIFFQKWSEKIIYLTLRKENDNQNLDKLTQIELYQKMLLLQFRKMNLGYESIIYFSNIDEIPSFEETDLISKFLIFEPIAFKQKNFLWSTKYINPKPHIGSFCFTLSQFLIDDSIIKKIYFGKDEIFSPEYKILESGYHFSQFCEKNKIIKMMNLTKDIELNLEQLEHLQSELKPTLNSKYFLKENFDELPQEFSILPSQKIDERKEKKFLVVLNFNQNRFEISNNNFDKIINLNFLKHYNLPNESSADNKTTNHNIFLPYELYYESENFHLEFGLNETKKILESYHPLNKDEFHFILFNNSISLNEKLVLRWNEIRNNFLFNLLYHFVMKNPSF